MNSVKVSVLMGIYNCESTLEEAVQSIQEQTYGNWELIMCDDGSSDHTYDVAMKLADDDPRITVIRNHENAGLANCLNQCLRLSNGELIARMDGDDVSLPDRFEKQIGFLQKHPEIAFVSTQMRLFDETGEWGMTDNPIKPQIRQVVCQSPFCHAPVMIRRAGLESVNGYTDSRATLRVEDVDLWIKLYTNGMIGENLAEPLYKMRNDRAALKRRKYRYRINSTRTRVRGCWKNHLGIDCYLKSLQPMIVGLVPGKVRNYLKRKRQRE